MTPDHVKPIASCRRKLSTSTTIRPPGNQRAPGRVPQSAWRYHGSYQRNVVTMTSEPTVRDNSRATPNYLSPAEDTQSNGHFSNRGNAQWMPRRRFPTKGANYMFVPVALCVEIAHTSYLSRLQRH